MLYEGRNEPIIEYPQEDQQLKPDVISHEEPQPEEVPEATRTETTVVYTETIGDSPQLPDLIGNEPQTETETQGNWIHGRD